MQPEDRVRIRHLVEAATTAATFVEGRQRRDLESDEMLRLALTKLVEIVGEAAKQVTAAGRAELPEFPGLPLRGHGIGWCTTTSTSTSTSSGRP